MKKVTGKSESIIAALIVRGFFGALLAGILLMSLLTYNIFDFGFEICLIISVGAGVLFALFGNDLLKWLFRIDFWT